MFKDSCCRPFPMFNTQKKDPHFRELNILAMAMQHASDGMIVTDRYNNIIKVNNAFIKTFGYDEEEILGKNTKFLSSHYQDTPFYHQTWNTLIKEKHWANEVWNQRKNGELFPAWVSISAIMDENHKIQNYLAIFTDLSALRQSEEKSLKLAYYDQVTGLPNRQKIVADMEKKNPSVCVIFNIDDFREINDFFGLEIGDALLKQLGEWFVTMNFSPYRIGGDEFAILLYEHFSWSDLKSRIAALMSLLEDYIFFIKGEAINVHMTVGAAIGHHKLLTRADIALNRAKKSKISLALYAENENIEETYRSNLKMSASIRTALAKGRIICHYQPIIDNKTDKIVKYETLVRMIDADGKLTLPSKFLSIAKKTKLYPQITLEVVKQACALFSTRSESFSLNLSACDILNPHVANKIIHIITKTDTAKKIVFELLESEGIENYTQVAEFIATVKHLGAKIAIDDFGTGYSNFENILKLNVDFIKIDGSLIQGITDQTKHHIVVESIINFATKIGAETIAEFVDSEALYHAVKHLGINYSQGFYLGKPAPIELVL